MRAFTPCGCERCTARRSKLRDASGCPCPECQPGPGVDHELVRRNSVAVRRARLRELLNEQDFRTLTELEDAELEGLLHLYLHREA